MKKFFIGLFVGYILSLLVQTVVAETDTSYISVESIWNKVFQSSTNTIYIRGE